MKKTMMAIGAALALTGCTAHKDATKSLIVYYSQTGATEQVANLLAQKTGADVLRIEAVVPYDGDFGQTIARCQEEMAAGVLPELQAMDKQVSDYDTIYVGYPIWFGTYAPPMRTFLRDVCLAGKVVVPFCTFGSGGLETGVANLLADQPEAVVLDGFGIRNARLAKAADEVEQFLIRLGVIAGEAAPLPEYGDEEDLTPATQAIFDEATNGYPMPLGTATKVAPATDGIHYCFEAESSTPDGHAMTAYIYVVKEADQPAEFTRVQR